MQINPKTELNSRVQAGAAWVPVTSVPRKPPMTWKSIRKPCSLLKSLILPNILSCFVKGCRLNNYKDLYIDVHTYTHIPSLCTYIYIYMHI